MGPETEYADPASNWTYAYAKKRNIEVDLSYKQLRIGCLQVQESIAEAYADADTDRV